MERIINSKTLRKYFIILTPLATLYYIVNRNRKENYKSQNFKNSLARKLPLRIFSRFFGKLSEKKLPKLIRIPFFYGYCLFYGVDKKEISQSIGSFASFNDLFTRNLDINKHREISDSEMISPVDGKVISMGKIDNGDLINAKGVKIPLESLIGSKIEENENLHYAFFYLAPGDYHRFHSPSDWSIHRLRHFVGDLIPVNSTFSRLFPLLFVNNERVVLEGKWRHGYCCFTPIGAFNVGSIRLSPLIDSELRTNVSNSQISRKIDFVAQDKSAIEIKKLEEMGYFKFGSSVVMIFQVPEGRRFQFDMEEGKKIKLGQSVGHIC